MQSQYLWLEPNDPKIKIADRFGSTIGLTKSCLSKEKQVELYSILVQYRKAFTLRHEKGTCPNTEVDI